MVLAILITASIVVLPKAGFDLKVVLDPVNQVFADVSEFVVETAHKIGLVKDDEAQEVVDPPLADSQSEVLIAPVVELNELPVVEDPVDLAVIPVNDAKANASEAKEILPPYRKHWKSPKYTANFAHTDAGCQWQGIAGQVFDQDGNPISNLIVRVTGDWNGKPVTWLALTGVKDTKAYGPGAFEIFFDSKPVDTTHKLRVQVFSPFFKALTYNFYFDTFSDCEKNLVIINFKKR